MLRISIEQRIWIKKTKMDMYIKITDTDCPNHNCYHRKNIYKCVAAIHKSSSEKNSGKSPFKKQKYKIKLFLNAHELWFKII
jgi:hypothetical protein